MHDWFALAVGLLVVGHIVMATKDPHAMTGIRTGRVPLRWARREHARLGARGRRGPAAPTIHERTLRPGSPVSGGESGRHPMWRDRPTTHSGDVRETP